MRIAIYEPNRPFEKQSLISAGSLFLRWFLTRRLGIELSPIDQADVILVSLQCASRLQGLQMLRHRVPGARIIAGGHGCLAPYSVGRIVDACCVGDGRNFLSVLVSEGFDAAVQLPNVWVDGESRPVYPDHSFPWDMPPAHVNAKAVRLWVGRGCKRRCKFCQTGWATPFMENPNPGRLIEQARLVTRAGMDVIYVANDLFQHQFADRLPPQRSGSFTLHGLRTHGIPHAQTVRIGVEGVSERLRKHVGKPMSTEELARITAAICNAGKTVRWFMIAGLPSETEADWQELRELVQSVKRHIERGLIIVSFTAFVPGPATPFASEPLFDDYWDRYLEFKGWFFSGIGNSRRFAIFPTCRPAARLRQAMGEMGVSEDELRRGAVVHPNQRVIYPYARQCEQARRADARRLHDPKQGGA